MTTTPTGLIPRADLAQLNELSDGPGLLRFGSHLLLIGAGGWLWAQASLPLALRLVGLVASGIGLATCFAPMHECGHRTAFANRRLNDACAWIAGLLSFYNATFYRRYHKWHHRYTQIPGKDPELSDPKPTTLGEYLREILGWNWWLGKVRGHWQIALGNLENHPYIAPNAHGEVIRSTRLQLLVYGIAIALSVAFRQPWFLIYWLLPLMIGQPLLRAILLAEHTGCSHDNNILTNTRTTLTLAPLRFLMWNMPYHAEHHVYPSLPFHALAPAHLKLGSYFAKVEPGYFYVNRQIIAQFGMESEPGE
jgi:fatty acid desaturase